MAEKRESSSSAQGERAKASLKGAGVESERREAYCLLQPHPTPLRSSWTPGAAEDTK